MIARDPITRFEKFLRRQGVGDDFFKEVAQAGDDLATEIREATFSMPNPPTENIFKHVYTDPHPLVQEQQAWLENYEASFEGDAK